MRRTLLALVTSLGLASGLLLTAPPSSAEEQPEAVRVYLEAMNPAIPGPDDTLRFRGRVINASDRPIEDVSIRLRRSSAPSPDRVAIISVADLGSTLAPDQGREPTDVPLTGTRVVIADELAPGQLGSFTLRVPISGIGFTEPGSYPIALEVLGRQTGVDEFDARQGMLRTFVPWVPTGTDVEPVSLAWLWPLASWPAQTVTGVLLDEQVPEELQPQGRLGQLLTVGDRYRSSVSWIVDPELVQVAREMSTGYRVIRDGVEVVGSDDATTRTWLTQLQTVAESSPLHALPYADVDASALTRGRLSTDVVRAVTRAPRVLTSTLGTAPSSELYWAPFGRIDRPTLDVLASAGVGAVVLSADALPALDASAELAGQATAQLPTDFGSMRVVLTDPGLTEILDLPQRTTSDVITARQRFLAETATVALTLGSPDRTVVAAPSSVRWDPTASLVAPLLRATRSALWLEPINLATLLDEPAPTTARRRGGYGEKARESELRRQHVAAIGRTTAQLEAFTSIIDNPLGVTEPFSEALLRAGSSGWRTQPLRGTELLDSIKADLDEETAKVRVLSEGTVTLSGESGRVPVTIVNDLDRSVTVGVALRSLPALRLQSEPETDIRIEAGKMASLDLQASVVGGEPLAVKVQLLGPEGQDYGQPATITLVSTAYARAASWVVVAAFVAIVIFVVVGVIRRIRKARMQATGPKGGGAGEGAADDGEGERA